MSVADAEATVTIQGSINLVQFKLYATGNATRIVVSTGIRKLMHAEIWIPIQRQCTDLKSSSNNRESVPTAWFMNITANPPTFVKAKHRCILRMVHLICRDALARGVGFRSDEIFSRTSPVLQVELNALETQEYWEPPIKAETKRQDLPPHLHSGKRRHSQASTPTYPVATVVMARTPPHPPTNVTRAHTTHQTELLSHSEPRYSPRWTRCGPAFPRACRMTRRRWSTPREGQLPWSRLRRSSTPGSTKNSCMLKNATLYRWSRRSSRPTLTLLVGIKTARRPSPSIASTSSGRATSATPAVVGATGARCGRENAEHRAWLNA
jgi:hypothetical protein